MNKLVPIAALVGIVLVLWVATLGGQKAQELPADGYVPYSNNLYSLHYPAAYSVKENYVHDIRPEWQAFGVGFIVDAATASGTNLGSDSGVYVETIPPLSSCSASPYVDGDHPAVTVVEDGKTYSVASSTGAGAGNFYEEIVYVRTDNAGPCPAVRYLIHTTNIANYPEGTVVQYDREKLLEEFDKIRLSLQTTPPGAPAIEKAAE